MGEGTLEKGWREGVRRQVERVRALRSVRDALERAGAVMRTKWLHEVEHERDATALRVTQQGRRRSSEDLLPAPPTVAALSPAQ